MSTTRLFIPNRIKVGFQKREDTYTKKLAYVIYYDQRGKLRKETSWESWRSKGIEPKEFTNEPTEGFVLNKGVGGARQSYGWNTRNEYIRVYDPRDFEFEISVSNLLFILRESVCNKGKGLEGKFVYAWDGTELVLLPEDSTDFQESKKHTDLQAEKVSAKELIPGATYLTKNHRTLTYLGRFEYNRIVDNPSSAKIVKKHVFWAGREFEVMDSISSIGRMESSDVTTDLARLIETYQKTEAGSRPVRLFLEEGPHMGYHNCWFREHNDQFDQCCHYSGSTHTIMRRIYLKDGVIVSVPTGTKGYSRYSYFRDQPITSDKPTGLKLFAEMENGRIFQIQDQEMKLDNRIKS